MEAKGGGVLLPSVADWGSAKPRGGGAAGGDGAMTSLMEALWRWLAIGADWVRGVARSQDRPEWAVPALEAAPDWAIMLPARS